MKLHWILALGLAGLPMAMAQQTSTSYPFSPSAPASTMHVNVRLVNVFANVTDAQGGAVGSLTKADFALSEDGRAQKISYFERDTDFPLSIVLSIDTSGSTRKDIQVEKAAARDFVHSLLRPVDQLDLMDFNSDVREVVPFTSNTHWIDAGLDEMDFGPATALYNAVYLGSQALAPRGGRKVLVLISDGGNTKEGVGYSQALEAARRGEVMVYSIIDVPIMADAGRDTDGEHAMITLSQETGGQYYYANAGDLWDVFKKVSESLRTQYLLGYYPDSEGQRGQYHSIQVTISCPQKANGPYRVQSRTGYYSSSNP